jgi:uncharacterized membrane protein
MLVFIMITRWIGQGLLTIIPIFVTFSVIKIVVLFLLKIVAPLNKILPVVLQGIPFIEFVVAIIIFMVIGIFVTHLPIGNLIRYIERFVFNKIPVIKTLYFSIKKITSVILKKPGDEAEQRVAWVRLPFKQTYCIGLMTSTLDKRISPDPEKTFYCFFIPTTPNPLTGYYVVSEASDCKFIPITRQEALSLVVSSGIMESTEEK